MDVFFKWVIMGDTMEFKLGREEKKTMKKAKNGY